MAVLEAARRALIAVEPRLARAEVKKERGTGHLALKPVGLWVVWDEYHVGFVDRASGAWLAVAVGLPTGPDYNAPLGWGLTSPAWAREAPVLCDGASSVVSKTANLIATAVVCADGLPPEVLRAVAERFKDAATSCFVSMPGTPPPSWARLPAETIRNSRR